MKYILLGLLSIMLISCGNPSKNEAVVADINGYELTLQEFEDKYASSQFASQSTPDAKKSFLDQLINQKLVLQEAQNQGLDQEKDFRQTVERFWEQSLLKVTLERKTKALSGQAQVSDQEIQHLYDQMVAQGITDQSYEQMYPQIKWQATKQKEIELMDNWIKGLRTQGKIKVNSRHLQ